MTRHARRLVQLARPARSKRDRARVHDQHSLSNTRRELLVALGRQALDDARALSEREVELGGDPAAAAERYQYLVDAVTHGLGCILTELARTRARRGAQ